MRGGAGGRQAATTEFPLYFFLFAHAGVPLVFKYFEVCFFHLVPQTVRLQLLPGISALSCARSVEDLNGACTVLRRKFRSATHLIPFELLYVITRNYRKIRIVPHKTKNYALYTRGKPCFFSRVFCTSFPGIDLVFCFVVEYVRATMLKTLRNENTEAVSGDQK